MDNNNNNVPYVVYEGDQVRSERCIKRLIIALVIAITLMFLSNALWLYAWCQYDYESEEVTYSQDGQGLNNINAGVQGGINHESRVDGEEED